MFDSNIMGPIHQNILITISIGSDGPNSMKPKSNGYLSENNAATKTQSSAVFDQY
jgi:hypothetical protein